MRACETSRLLRIVCEISLTVLVGVVTDDFHGVLVGTHCSVGSESVELGLEHTFAADVYFGYNREREVGHVILDTDGESFFGCFGGEIAVHFENLRRSGVLGTEAVTSADYHRGVLPAVKTVAHIEVEGLTVGSWFLGAVEHGNPADTRRHSGEEMTCREGAVEMHRHKTHLLAVGAEIVDGLLYGLSHRSHSNDHAVGLRIAVIIEEAVIAAREAVHLLYIFLHYFRNSLIISVACLAVLEEHVGVLGHTAGHGGVRIQGAGAEFLQRLAVQEGCEVFLRKSLDFLDFMRGAETVEEIDERHTAPDCRKMSYSSKIHHLLHAAFAEHGETGLAGAHHILMVPENTESMGSECTRRHMEHTGKEFAGNLVHIRNHQQETLRRCICRGESTGLKRAVDSTCGTGLTLHLLDMDCLAEDILSTGSRPVIDILRHRRRGSDGIDRRHLAKHVAYMRGSLIAIACQEFLCFTHFFAII